MEERIMKRTVMSLLCVICIVLSSTFLFGATSTPKAALDFPTSTVKIIVPYAAGGGTDLIARALAKHFSETWKVSVIVENKTGGSGAVGMSSLAGSKADGHTVILTALGAATMTPILNDVGYTNVEFAPIAQVTAMDTALCVHSNSGIKTFKDFFARASAKPGQFTYGTTGASSLQNLLTAQLQQEMGLPNVLTHIPYDGGAKAIMALMGEQINACVAMVPDLLTHIKSGTFIPLCVYTTKRIEELPAVPSIGELGFPSLGIPTWYGFAAPAKTPKGILDFWDNELRKALTNPEMINIFKTFNQNAVYLNRADFTTLWMNTYKLNTKMLKGSVSK
jgi:tripartite-type tricarboxylate transporter receptor subunit TctC